jgi:hypothetical protein
MVYEHRLYLPSVGPFVLFSLFLVRGIDQFKRRVNFLKPAGTPVHHE